MKEALWVAVPTTLAFLRICLVLGFSTEVKVMTGFVK